MTDPKASLVSLNQLMPGDAAVLARIGGERSFRRRLMEMGLLPGTRVRVVRRVEVGGLVQLEVRGCNLSLRLSEAEQLSFHPNGSV
jgi:Fe2+ transport system protein FeoA